MAQKSILSIDGGVAGLSCGIYGQMYDFNTHIMEICSLKSFNKAYQLDASGIDE